MRSFHSALKHFVRTCWQDAWEHGSEYGETLTQNDVQWILSHLHRKPTSDEWYSASLGISIDPVSCYQWSDIPADTLDRLFFDAVRYDDPIERNEILCAKAGDRDAQDAIVRTVTALDALDRMEYAL